MYITAWTILWEQGKTEKVAILTLFKFKKSSEWKCHTMITSISVCIQTRDSKFVIIDKFCRHSFSSNVPEIKVQSKMSILSILSSNFSLIWYFSLGYRQIFLMLTILASLVRKLIGIVGFVVCHFHWELFLGLNSVS